MNEFDLIAQYFSRPSRQAWLGVGDDAALIPGPESMAWAISKDVLVEGRHFLAGTDPERLGHKTLAVNLSDLAAMGAEPRFALLGLTLPEADPAWLMAFSRGFFALARRYGVELIGGDTTSGPRCLSISILGLVEPEQALRRAGARMGDDIWVSGSVGDAALGLASLQGRLHATEAAHEFFVERLERPQPRIALGLALRGLAHSAIDVSDGLLGDLHHILQASRVGAVVHAARVPVSAYARTVANTEQVLHAALTGGDDYELCFTAAPIWRERLDVLSKALGLALTRIGSITPEAEQLDVLDARGQLLPLTQLGFDHFAPPHAPPGAPTGPIAGRAGQEPLATPIPSEQPHHVDMTQSVFLA